MIEVEVPDLGIVEFPDDATPEFIQGALTKHFAEKGYEAATDATQAALGVLSNPAAAEASDQARRETKKAQYAEEKKRLQFEQGLRDVGEGAIDLGTRAAYTVEQMHPLKAIRPIVNPYGQSIIPPEAALAATEFMTGGPAAVGSVGQGAQQFAADMISGLGQVENLPAFAVGVPAVTRAVPAAPALVGRLFQTEMAGGIPQQIQQVQQAETPAEAVRAGLGLGATGLMIGGIEAGLSRPKVPIPQEITKGSPNANQVQSAVENVRRETPRSAAQVAEGSPGEVQQATGTQEARPPVVSGNAPQAQGQVLLKVSNETGVDLPTVEKGVRVEAKDHPDVAASNPEILPTLVRDELKLDKKAYDKDKDPATGTTQPQAEVAPNPERIVAAASRLGDTITTGKVHFESEKTLRDKLNIGLNDRRVEDIEHGFVTDKGRFVDQEEAAIIAKKANQLAQEPEAGILGSHDLKAEVAPEAKPSLSDQGTAPQAAAPSAASGEIGNRVVEQPATQPPAISEAKPTGQKTQVAERKPDYLIAAEEASQKAYEGLGAAEKGAYDKSKRKKMTKAQKAQLLEFDKLVEAEKAAKKQWQEERKSQPTSPPTTEIVGMGGARPGEFARGQGSPTAMKYRLIDEERQKRGLAPLSKPEGRSDQAVMDRAMAAIDNDPALPERLVRELNQSPRAIEDWENHVLLLRKIDLREAYEKSAREAMQAYEDSKQFPERLNDMVEANKRTQDYSKLLSELEEASRVSGSARGRALRALQVMANEDYSLAALEMKARSLRNWAELPPEEAAKERAELSRMAEEHAVKSAAYEKRIAELEKQQADTDAQIALDKAKAAAEKEKLPSPYILKLAERVVGELDKRADAARIRLRERMGRMSSGVDPTIIIDLAEIGASHIAHVGLDFAKWSARMIEDVGDWAKPYLDEAWKASQKTVEDTVQVKAPKKVAADVKKAIAKQEIDAIAATTDKIKARIEARKDQSVAKQQAAVVFFIRRLGRLFVERGVNERNELVDSVHNIVKDIVPEMTRRDTLDVLSGYGDYTQLPKDTVSTIYRDLKGQLQQVAKLEDMAKGESPMRSGREQRTPSDEERRLQKQVEEAKRRGGYVQTDPTLQLRTAMQEVQRRLENEIADLDYQIQTRTKIVKEKTKLEYDEPTKRLQAIRDEKKAIYNEIFKKPGMTEAERLAKWKERTIDRTAELKEILEGKRQPKQRRQPVELDSEALRLKFEKNVIERQVREKFAAEAWKQKRWIERLGYNIWDAGFNVPRAILTSGELSGVLRQGKLVIAGHPIMGLKSIGPMLRAAFSEKAAFDAAQKLIHRENAPLYEMAKLDFTEHGGKLSSMEEAFMSRLAPRIPGIGRFVRGSERAYITFLNKLRADYFDYLAKSLTVDGKGNIAELQHIANLVNVATGRGGKSAAKVASALNSVFFSPRYSISRFQYLLGQPLRGGTLRTKAIIAGEYARQLMGIAGVLSLAYMAGFKVGTDPKSADFGKIIIGDTRIDVLAGLAQVFVLMNRLASGKRTTRAGETVPIRRTENKKLPYGAQDSSDVILNFIRQKAAPTPALTMNLLSGQNQVGQYFGPKQLLQQSLVPITYSDIYQVLRKQDLPTGVAASLLAFLGEGVNTYQNTK